MTTFIEDSARNLTGWISDAVAAGTASAAVLTPWVSPYPHGIGVKRGFTLRAQEFRDYGIPCWFDPATHALQMPGVGDFRFYHDFDLWGGPIGDLTTDGNRREHVRRVFRRQDEIGAVHLAPAPLLATGLNNLSMLALETSRVAIEQHSDAWLTIAGTGSFWSDGSDLDAHVGGLAALQPAGWFISFVHPNSDMPPKLTAEEIYGISRTVRALAEHAPVHVSHGDFAALPAVAAGATSVGTGWDKSQRAVAYTNYAARPLPVPGKQSGGWLERSTLRVLLGSLSKSDGALLQRQDPRLAARLGGLPVAPGAKDSFPHHAVQLDAAVRQVEVGVDYEARCRQLDVMYTQAARGWAALQTSTGIRDQSARWVTPLQQGLRLYAAGEGWTL
jgi:hypothetical protein